MAQKLDSNAWSLAQKETQRTKTFASENLWSVERMQMKPLLRSVRCAFWQKSVLVAGDQKSYHSAEMAMPRPMDLVLAQPQTGVTDDAELVAELQAGSEAAFAYLVGVYQNPIYNLIFHMIGDSAEAADVLQDVFLKIFRGIRQFHQQSSLRTWIYTIAIREALNERRSRRRRLSHETLSVESEGFSEPVAWRVSQPSAASPDRLVEQSERQRVVRRALAALGEPYRAALILREIENLSYEEIAQVLGVAEGTVKSRLKRGRDLLRRKLECQLHPKG